VLRVTVKLYLASKLRLFHKSIAIASVISTCRLSFGCGEGPKTPHCRHSAYGSIRFGSRSRLLAQNGQGL